MTELKGFEERKGAHRIKGAEHGVHPGRKTWLEEREHELATLGITEQPYVVIVGGGQGGIALGARLRRLGVPAIIAEKNAKPGDSWRKRYKSLCLHDPVWYDHLPYLPFPDDWPVFAPKDKIGDWLEMYSKVMELNYWGSTTAKTARFEEATKTWQVVVERDGKELTLRPKELVFALGVSGLPNVPNFPGADSFQGEQQHSSRHSGPEAYKGKKCVVIGSNNSAHDLRRAVGARRRRDDGSAQFDPHRAVGLSDGTRARRAVFRQRREVRCHYQQGRSDLRVDPVQGHGADAGAGV